VDSAEVVIEVRSVPAMLSLTRPALAGAALAPPTHPANVLTCFVSEENVGREAVPPKSPFETAGMECEGGKVAGFGDRHQEVDIFRRRLRRGD
jgi:hypothetical protein